MKIIQITGIIMLVFIMTACGGSTVDTALSQVEKAVGKVEKNKTTMTEADWQAFNKDLEAPCKILNDALEGDKVGALKKLKIASVMLRFTAIVGEAAMHTAVDELGRKMEETHVADSISVAIDAALKQLNSIEPEE